MPIYEFQCVKCGEIREEIYFTSEEMKEDREAPECPVCGGKQWKSVMSTGSFIIKGGY